MRKRIMSFEAIHFQGDAFFKELTACVKDVTEMPLPGNSVAAIKAFYESDKMLSLIRCVHEYTKISLKYDSDYYDYGPAVCMPLLNKNHIFFNDWERHDGGGALDRDAKLLIAELKKPFINGSVDLRKNRIGGDYCKINCVLAMPVFYFYSGKLLPEELAALILHEVGHVLITFEFIDRTLKTNQVLSATAAALNGGNPDVIKTVITSAEEILKLTPEQKAAFEKITSIHDASVILHSCAIDKSITDLGASVYDSVSCEQLADQYASRCGAGKALVLALDKIVSNEYKYLKVTAGQQMLYASLAVAGFVYPLLGIVIAISLFGQLGKSIVGGVYASKGEAEYDNFPSRIRRVKEQLIERLKDKSLPNIEKAKTLADIAEIDAIASKSADSLKLYEKIAYLLKPSYRNAHKYEILQKELEQLSSNNLFIHSAKLSII